MVFPDNWVQLNEVGRRARSMDGSNQQPFLIVQTKNAVTGEVTDLDGSQELKGLEPKKMTIGLKFADPSSIS